MQVVRRSAEHSSRRKEPKTSAGAKENNSSDVDGTAHRVASVTLNTESDSRTSANDAAPMSFRSKRRKKLPRREKAGGAGQQEMEIDEQHQSPPWKKQSLNATPEGIKHSIPTCKLQMDWDEQGAGPSATINGRSISGSDMDNGSSQSADQLSSDDGEDSEASASNLDADDEQSDWPGNELGMNHRQPAAPRPAGLHQLSPGGRQQRPATSPGDRQKDAAMGAGVVKRIEQFLREGEQRELLLDQVYRTSAVKQMLRGQPVAVQIVKRGRGTVALKKI